MVNKINDSVKKKGMRVNVGKTKVMVFERGESTTECDILIENEKVDQAKEFVYLENKENGALLAIMNGKRVSVSALLAICDGVLIFTLMHGSESWVWQKKNESEINAVDMQSLRSICEVPRNDRYRNSDVV
ncbi:hypothetical protein EVAR_75714_1 [Eumeta japonica]|uniref:Uncharacterized protein n=1 Tax=Eumeta variegata TaxID=151549 RepID=A0A4C1W412_EUMVA|nr:hypothetical protein EVAR_75714_1 [Eumeta japonica]